MKQNLRLRACYIQIIRIFKRLKISNSSLLAILTIMCLEARTQPEGTDVLKNFEAPDQPSAAMSGDLPDTLMPLQIGDTIPEYLWHLPLQVVNHSKGKETITLEEYRDKLIILDFWATWCSPCIKSVEHIDTLLSNNNLHDAVLIPVSTYDDAPQASAFIAKRGWQLLSVVNDKTLVNALMGAYRGMLGVVWLKDGKLYAVPRKASITLENLQAAMNNAVNQPAIVNFQLKATEGQ